MITGIVIRVNGEDLAFKCDWYQTEEKTGLLHLYKDDSEGIRTRIMVFKEYSFFTVITAEEDK